MSMDSSTSVIKTYRKHFIPLESNPDVFNQLIRLLGAPESLVFEDVFTLDEPDFLPHPALALILIFPTAENYDEQRAAEDASHEDRDSSRPDENVVWFKQTINNACGLYAILHALSNGEARSLIEPGSLLSRILDSCSGLPSHQQALFLEESEELETAYNLVAIQGDSAVPNNPEDEVDFHYVCFVKSGVDGRLYELDGDRKGPIDRGSLLELDDDVLGQGGLRVIREYIEKEQGNNGNDGFGLMALVRREAT